MLYSKMVKLAVLLMVKDEEKTIETTLKTLPNIVDGLIVYDTGSTDNTVQIIKDFCMEAGIKTLIKEGKFIDFATSRNIMLDSADAYEEFDFFLILDSNDQVRNIEGLKEFLSDTLEDTFYITRACQYGDKVHRFKDVKLIRRGCGWRYHGKVHEYIDGKGDPVILPTDLELFQNRDQDVEKSRKRYVRDLQILQEEYQKNKTPRTIYYLARTHHSLGNTTEAIKYFSERARVGAGNWEEAYHSMYQCGLFSEDWVSKRRWFMEAWELGHRVEPLLRMAEYYRSQKDVASMYMMVKMACDLPFPRDHVLDVNHEDYDYTRWHLLGLCGFYYRKWEDGELGSELAYKCKDLQVDRQMLAVYLQRKNIVKQMMTKTDYISERISAGILKTRAETEWIEFGIDEK